ncbi:MAG: LptF/LptG family permease [Alphaproteobacteria bacterium]|nr:LptF/LptG family permease [Alphaproteobacteria bacterium]
MLMTRYLMKNLLAATVFIALTLTMVVWLTQSLKLLELVASSDAPPLLFLKMVVLTLPKFLEIILPLSLVTAILFAYNRLIMDNELIVLRSCGFDQYALARPALLLAGLMAVLLMAMTTYISPASYTDMLEMRQEVKAKYSSFLLRAGVFNTFGKELTVYLQARAPNGDLTGLMIHDTRDKTNPPVTITAKRGQIVMQDGMPNIIVYDGLRQQMDPASNVITKLYFERYTVEIKGFENDSPTRWRKPEERTLMELLHPNMKDPADVQNRGVFLAEASNRVLSPLNAIGFSLVALSAILLGPFNRRGQTRKVLTGAIAIVMLQALDLALLNATKKHPGMAVFLYLTTLLPIAFGAYALHLKGEQKIMALLRRWNALRNRRWEAKTT